MSDKILIVCVIFVGIGLFVLGWFSNEMYKDWNNKKIIAGLWIPDTNKTGAIQTSLKLEGTGNWVCINVKGSDYEEIIKTCIHESSHELFSRECEKNITKCIDAVTK
jgi:hypothetical protein